MICAALLWWLFWANTLDGKFLYCSSVLVVKWGGCALKGKLFQSFGSVLLTPRSCIFHCRDEFFILLFGCEAGWWLWH